MYIVKISNNPAPKIRLMTKQVNIKPGLIGFSIEDSKRGCQANKKIFKTP